MSRNTRTYLEKRQKQISDARKASEKKYHQILVISPGGVASSMLNKHLSNFVQVNDVGDKDGLKHLPTSKDVPKSAEKVIYVHGDFYKAVRSLQRRGHHRVHVVKLGMGPFVASGRFWRPVLLILIIRQYLSFRIAAITTHKGKIFLLKYQEIWDQKEEIRKFANISDDNFLDHFPPRKQRKTV